MKQKAAYFGMVLALAASAAVVSVADGAAKRNAKAGEKLTLADAGRRVDALDTLLSFEFTPAQRSELKRMSGEIAAPAPADDPPDPKPGENTRAYRRAMNDLIAALAKLDVNNDADVAKVDDLREKSEKLAGELEYDLPDPPAPTPEALHKATDFLKTLSPRQLIAAIADVDPDEADPAVVLVDAVETKKSDKADESWDDARKEAATTAASLVDGPVGAETKALADKLSKWLDAAPELDDAAFAARRGEIEADARKVVGKTDGVLLLRHRLELDLAALLMNPELPEAVDALERK
jgi:hypothetical protein